MKAKETFSPTGLTGLTGFLSGHPDDGRKKSTRNRVATGQSAATVCPSHNGARRRRWILQLTRPGEAENPTSCRSCKSCLINVLDSHESKRNLFSDRIDRIDRIVSGHPDDGRKKSTRNLVATGHSATTVYPSHNGARRRRWILQLSRPGEAENPKSCRSCKSCLIQFWFFPASDPNGTRRHHA
jgi:hypothetical protein